MGIGEHLKDSCFLESLRNVKHQTAKAAHFAVQYLGLAATLEAHLALLATDCFYVLSPGLSWCLSLWFSTCQSCLMKIRLREQTAADRVWPDGVSATLQLPERGVAAVVRWNTSQYTGSRPT